jgi:signal peptidase II
MRLLLQTAFVALLIDQSAKYLVVHWMALDRLRAIDVLPPLLNFRYGENRGINFGLLTGDGDWIRWALIGFSLVVIAGVLYWVRRWHTENRWMHFFAGLLAGGALGNVVDRLLYGYVLDFLNMSCCGIRNPFVFNTADIFIFAGAIALVFLDNNQSKKKAA